jgi:hypothetical protein
VPSVIGTKEKMTKLILQTEIAECGLACVGIGAIAEGPAGAVIGGSVGFVAGVLVNGVVSGINSIRLSNN